MPGHYSQKSGPCVLRWVTAGWAAGGELRLDLPAVNPNNLRFAVVSLLLSGSSADHVVHTRAAQARPCYALSRAGVGAFRNTGMLPILA